MSTNDTSTSTSTSTPASTPASTPTFGSKQWFIQYKLWIGIGVVVLGAIIAVSIFTGKGTDDGNNNSTGRMGDSPVNGKWGPWENCKETNDLYPNGKKKWKRTRQCIQPSQNGGKPCSEIDGGKSEEICTPVNGQWVTPEDSEEVCYKNAQGDWVKKQICSGTANGGEDCVGSAEVKCTPINGSWPTLGFDDPKAVCELSRDKDGNIKKDDNGREIYYKTITCQLPEFGGQPCPNRMENGVINIKEGDQVVEAKLRCSYFDGAWSDWRKDATGKICVPKGTGSNLVKTRTCTLPTTGGLPCTQVYPMVNLVSNSDSGYVASASSVLTCATPLCGESYYAFDGNKDTFWHSTSNYLPLTGKYNGATLTSAEGKSWRGDWIQFEFPSFEFHSAFKPIAFTITPRTTEWSGTSTTQLSREIWKYRSPRKFVLLASKTVTNGVYTWKVLYDNTGDSNTGVIDWTADPKKFVITNPPIDQNRFYRLVVTQVGQFDSLPASPPIDQGSVQIAGLTFTGTPLVSSTNTKEEVLETIPCDADCRYGSWGNCEYDTSNKKWVQKRPMTAPVGAGALCVTANAVRDCPNTATNWSGWGAFYRNGAYYGSGAISEFVASPDAQYTENSISKQLAYIKLSETQACPTDTQVTDGTNRICYKYRNVYGEYGSCNLAGNDWIQIRDNIARGTKESKPCTPDSNWQLIGQGNYRVKARDADLYLSGRSIGDSEGRCWDCCDSSCWGPAKKGHPTPSM
ncbi:MAG: hypothetical protein EBU82_13335, partial [Flavobacteriia bacterium]|nr:hypothetical protein [Flavobacteriia bacterium]